MVGIILTFSLSSIVVSLSLPVVEVSPFLVLDEASDADVTDTDDTEKCKSQKRHMNCKILIL